MTITEMNEEELNEIPLPSNELLRSFFDKTTHIVVKNLRVKEDERFMFEVVDSDEIASFLNTIEMNEKAESFYVLDSGEYSITLFNNDDLIADIEIFEGSPTSIRCNSLEVGNMELITAFRLFEQFSKHGFNALLTNYIDAEKRVRLEQQNYLLWKQLTPDSITRDLPEERKFTTSLNFYDESYLSSIIEEFSREVENVEDQVIQLLRSYGYTNNYWTDLPIYERIVENLIQLYDIELIITSYNNSTKEIEMILGLGRLLCSSIYIKDRSKVLSLLSKNTIDEIVFVYEQYSDLEVCWLIYDLKKKWLEIYGLNLLY